MPFFFSQRRTLRQWAARVLLAWLFGLGVGVAHGCVVTQPLGAGAPPAAQAAGAEAPVAHAGCTGHDAAHDAGAAAANDTSPANANCQDFCGKAATTLPPLKTALDDADSHALFAAAVLTAAPVPAFTPATAWSPRREGAWAPPVPLHLAFLRLTR